MKKIKTLLCRWFPRYKLHCILRTLGLDARRWQIKYALGKSNYLPTGRCTGKTVAVMLRMLMANPKDVTNLAGTVWRDPDYEARDRQRILFYRSEYDLYSRRCLQAGIPVPLTIFSTHHPTKPVWAVVEGKP